MTRPAAALAGIAVGALLAGCGGPSAGEVLQQTTSNLPKIKSAHVRLRLVLEPRDAARGGRVGFALDGPLQIRPGGLPVAQVGYTQIAGKRQAQATFLSTGTEAFVEVAGTPYRLSKRQTRALTQSAGSVRGGANVPLGRWLQDPKVADGEKLDGTSTDHLSAKLDVATALRDIFRTAAAAGAAVPDLSGARADELRNAITSSSVDAWSGQGDHYLRRLRLAIGFRVTPPRGLRQKLGDLVGGRLAFDVDLTRINAPVHVQAPAHPKPPVRLR